MKKVAAIATVLVSFVSLADTAHAQALSEVWGKVTNLYADPSDVVIELDARGVCGSKFFHVRRSNANFREMTAIALAAYTTGTQMHLYVAPPCVGDRNVVDHGAVSR